MRVLHCVCLGVLLGQFAAYCEIFIIPNGELIQDAVDVASDGDTLILDDGPYTETVILGSRSLTIGSRFLLDGMASHISLTQIQPDASREDTGSVFVVVGAPDISLELSGLTIRNGRGTLSSGLSSIAGGGVYVRDTQMSIRRCIIRDCEAESGAGVCVEGTSEFEFSARLSLQRATVLQNGGSIAGGGLYSEYCQVDIDSCDFLQNEASQLGGGAYIRHCTLSLSDTRFSGNDAESGAGLRIRDNTGEVTGCRFENNGFDTTGICSHLHCTNDGVVISGCYFGASESGLLGVLLYSSLFDSVSEFRGNVVEGLVTRFITGSVGVFSGAGRISHNIFRSNNNINGGAVYMADGANIRIDHNVFLGNRSEIDSGGSVLQMAGVNTVRLDSNWIVGNFGPTLTCNIVQSPCNEINARNNWWGHASGPYHAELNPAGEGDTVVGEHVAFTPWLLQPPDCTTSVRPAPELPASWQVVSVYPNPFNGELRIEIAGFSGEGFAIELFDLLGRSGGVVHRGRVAGGTLTIQAPPQLASGIYFLRAGEGAVNVTRKVVLLK